MLSLLRPFFARLMMPLGRTLAKIGLTPNAITLVGTGGVVVGALAFYPRGELLIGTLVITFFVFADLLDGVLARISGVGSRWGAFLDSTLDRLGDAAILSGLILWFAGRGDDMLLAGLALFCLVTGVLVPYVKARAEGLGMACEVGVAERSERLIIVLVSIGLAGFGLPYVLAGGLWLLAALSTVTVAQRCAYVYQQAMAAGRRRMR